jgi:uncharacterized caspase-like protein
MKRPAKPSQSDLLVCLLCLLGATLATPSRADVRVLVWAADYRDAGNADLQLPNTMVDARNVTGMFRKLGVRDLQLIENPTADVWDAETAKFAQRLGADDVAVLYYAGHAVQVNGENFFLAGDGITLISSEQVMLPVMAKARGTVFLIDACRDNPFRNQPAQKRELKISTGTAKSRAIETLSLDQLARNAGGLSQMSNLRGKNTIVVFSTDPGNVALDGEPGQGSPFATAMVREFAKRQSLDAAIRQISAAVDKSTHSKQAPWRQGDLSFPLFLAGQPRFPVP